MATLRIGWQGSVLLVLCLLLVACATAVREAALPPSPLEQESPLSTPLPEPVATATALPKPAKPTAQASPAVTGAARAAAAPVQLVVLHTNDNWGETEPCG